MHYYGMYIYLYIIDTNNIFLEVIYSGSMCGGSICGITASWLANTLQVQKDWVALYTVGGFMIGMSISSSLLNSVSTVIQALFVLYAEEPKILMEHHPEQNLRLSAADKCVA